MVIEVPKLRRCCFCIPLRRGLLFWSYLHMVAAFIIGAFGIYGWSQLVILCNTYNYSYHEFNVIGIGAMYLNIAVNCFLSGLLIYGAHKKNHKILKIQYYSATVSVITYTITVIINFAMILTRYWDLINSEETRIAGRLLIEGIIMTIYIIIQLYVIVLVRSEVFKLRDNQQFQFTNNAADAEANCTLYVGNKEKSNSTTQ